MKKRLISLIAIVSVICCNIFFVFPFSANATNTTISALRSKFPNGAYWNGGNADGYTWTPCQYHAIGYVWDTCNYFYGYQCYGFANKLAYEYYGSIPTSSWSRHKDLSIIKPGDVIRNNGHTQWVVGVDGDTIYIADCNYGCTCQIRWDIAVKKSSYTFPYYYIDNYGYDGIYAAPYAAENGTSPQTQGDYIGDDFYAYIINNSKWIYVAANNNNVELGEEKSAIMRDYDPKQIWHFIRKNNYNQYEIINEYDGKALDISSTELCTNVQTYQRNNTAGQLWVLKYKPSGSGEMTIHPALNPDMALDVAFGVYHGNNIQIYTTNSCDGQLFAIYPLSRNGYNYAVPKPAAPAITSAYSYGNVLNLKWAESPKANLFDNGRRYGIYIYDSNNTLIQSASADDKTEYACFLPKVGSYSVRVAAEASAYDSSFVPAYSWSEPVSVTVTEEVCTSLTNEKNGNVYLLFDTSKDYKGAKEYCELLGGHLATITSAEEQEIITDLCKSGNNENYWLGGTDEASEGVWKWITGEKWSYTNWNEGEPSNMEGVENYLHYIKTTNNWNDTNSSFQMGFICEIEQNTVASSVKKETNYNGHRYILFDQSLPWTEAKKYCESIGGHLVTICSAEESNAVLPLISEGAKSRYWIGAANENGDQWSWPTKEPFDYTHWNDGEPNNDRGIEKYAHLIASGEKKGFWNDASNYASLNLYGFVLEIDDVTPYRINSLLVRDSSGEVLPAIPQSKCLVSVALENVDADDDALVVIAAYREDGLFDGLLYANAKKLPKNAEIELTLPFNNSDGSCKQLKAFVLRSFSDITPLGKAVTFGEP